ncbi:hypothetical protein, partial [Shigella sonnei]|uniref:hypothetical protein n=1 Tax=Shigella sonnei TaxID=624 RepID=UPI001C0A7C0D
TGGTADRNRSHWSTSKTPSYTKSVSWQHHPTLLVLQLSAYTAYSSWDLKKCLFFTPRDACLPVEF